jgi:hypothetical protein
MTVVALREAKIDESCHEVSKLRDDGKFDRWCYKHHHWLNDAPPQRTASDELLLTTPSAAANPGNCAREEGAQHGDK